MSKPAFTVATSAKVLNRGRAPLAFLREMVTWARGADEAIFAPNAVNDIYSKVKPELGPYTSPIHRKAVMLEVMRVLAGFESSWDWTEGVDTSRLGSDTAENSEAGAWQVSWDSRNLMRIATPEMVALLKGAKVTNGVTFQQATKFNHPFAMEWLARLLRANTKHNGPLYRGDERLAIRKSLRGPEHSIFPWLRREAVAEFEVGLTSLL